MKKEKIEDWGEKIGFARKDIANGFTADVLLSMNEAERKKYVTRANVWPLPNSKQIVESGVPAHVAYWQRAMRRATKRFPYVPDGASKEEAFAIFAKYTNAMNALRKEVLSVRTDNAMNDFAKSIRTCWTYSDAMKLESAANVCDRIPDMKEKCRKSGFPNNRRKSGGKRKTKFIPPQLERIEREGPEYRTGDINSDIWQRTFHSRGVEFGNWMSQKDRQVSINYAYDALCDLKHVLGVSDISFGGELAWGFGSRGYSHAAAHYEPCRKVINLTKMHGAGSVAHEWAHALDNQIAEWEGASGMASELGVGPESFIRLVNALQTDSNGNPTDFYRGSAQMDLHFARDAHGYWASKCEMFARAFACYVKDNLGCKSDYLIAHADVYELEFEDEHICAIPQGEERELFDDLFDMFLYELSENGFFDKPMKMAV